MQTATIIPRFVNPPKGNASSASIKDKDGVYWGIPASMMAKFAANVAVTVNYEETPPNQEGRTYRNIKSIVETPKPVAQAMAQSQASTGRDIFITGVVQRAMQTGKFDVTDIKRLTLATADAWDAAHSPRTQANGQQAPQRREEPPPYEQGDPGPYGDYRT